MLDKETTGYGSASLGIRANDLIAIISKIKHGLPYSSFEALRKTVDIPQKELPANWKVYPAPTSTRVTGDRWAGEMSSLILKVPSTLIPVEQTFLINPKHPDFAKLTINDPHPLSFDPRLK